jgi:hypothetical protein
LANNGVHSEFGVKKCFGHDQILKFAQLGIELGDGG